jgi:hypothetical protein
VNLNWKVSLFSVESGTSIQKIQCACWTREYFHHIAHYGRDLQTSNFRICASWSLRFKNYPVDYYQHCLHGSGLLGSEKQWLWEFTCYRSEMLKHFSEKLNFITKKKWKERQSRRKSKICRLPFLISQQKRVFDQNSFTIQMSLRVFYFAWKWQPQNFDFRGFDV